MHWYFCGANGDCWTNWFWSNATAAWVQAIAATILIIVTVRLWTNERMERRKEKADRIHQNIVLVKTTLVICFGALKRAENGLTPDEIGVAEQSVLEMRSLLLHAVKSEMPNPQILAYIQGRVGRMILVEKWLSRASQRLARDTQGVDQFQRRKTRLDISEQLGQFAREMDKAHDKIQEFHERWEHDPRATWKEEAEGDQGSPIAAGHSGVT